MQDFDDKAQAELFALARQIAAQTIPADTIEAERLMRVAINASPDAEKLEQALIELALEWDDADHIHDAGYRAQCFRRGAVELIDAALAMET